MEDLKCLLGMSAAPADELQEQVAVKSLEKQMAERYELKILKKQGAVELNDRKAMEKLIGEHYIPEIMEEKKDSIHDESYVKSFREEQDLTDGEICAEGFMKELNLTKGEIDAEGFKKKRDFTEGENDVERFKKKKTQDFTESTSYAEDIAKVKIGTALWALLLATGVTPTRSQPGEDDEGDADRAMMGFIEA